MAQELFKLLTAAGMDPTENMSDGQLVDALMNAMKGFDPKKKMTEQDVAFSMQTHKFMHQAKKKRLREERKAQREMGSSVI